MKFGMIPVQQAEGKIFAHNVAGTDGRSAFRKGKTISGADVQRLARMGYQSVYAAELEAGDVDENSAARRIALAACGVIGEPGDDLATGGLRLQGHAEGRVNLVAQAPGLLRVDEARLEQVNGCEGLAFATLRSYSLVQPGQTVGTVKIIPYALPPETFAAVIQAAEGREPLIQVKTLKARRVGVIYAGSSAASERVSRSFGPALRRRVEALQSHIEMECTVRLTGQDDEVALATSLRWMVEHGAEVMLIAGETSTMDVHDIIPCAVQAAGGQVVCVGAPIEPGNLVMLADIDGTPLLNVPGCVRSPSPTQVDQILAALLAGDRLTRAEIIHLGHGGLVEGGKHGT